MTCHSPTHRALITIGGDTYCATCFKAGFEFALDRAGVVYGADAEEFYRVTGLNPGGK